MDGINWSCKTLYSTGTTTRCHGPQPNDNQHNNIQHMTLGKMRSVIMLCVAFIFCYSKYLYAECCYAECRFAECLGHQDVISLERKTDLTPNN